MSLAFAGRPGRWKASLAAVIGSPDARALAAILILSTSLNAVGIAWGLPALWAADELSPGGIAKAMQAGFSNGWHELYPPFHFQVLAGIFFPLLSLHAQGIDALRVPDTYVRFYVLMRVVSLVMGAGCVVLVYRIGLVLADRRTAVLGALILALSPPFVYYAKMANLDVPYTFWFLASVWCFVQALTRDRLRDWSLLGITAALAITTKDQAYGLYVLAPLVVVIWGYGVRRTRHERFALARAVVNVRTAAALGAFAVTFLLVHNVFFNWPGFLRHVQLMREAQGTYRMFEGSAAGHAGLAALTIRHWRFWMGLPALGAAIAGIAYVVTHPRRYAVPLALLSFVASYQVFFVHVALYDYDRFQLPVVALLAPLGGAVFGWLTRPGAAVRWIGRVLVVVALGSTLTRALVVDVLMVTDPQYCAQAWLTANVPRDAPILVLGPFSDVIDLTQHPRTESVDIQLDDFSIGGAEYFIASSLYGEERFEGLPKSLELFRSIIRGRPPFRLAAVCPAVKLPVRLNFDGVYSNLRKIGPEVRIYHRAR